MNNRLILNPLIQSYIDYLKFEKRYSEHTVRAYQDDLAQFFQFLEERFGEQNPNEISSAFVRSWLASLKDQKLTSKSIVRKISSLRSFFKYQLRMGALQQTPMAQISIPKMAKRLPVFVSEKDMSDLFSQIEFPDNWQGLTDRLLISIFYNTGIRLAELIQLREDKLDFGHRSIKVLGKGSKERIIPISAQLQEAMKDYLRQKSTQLEQADRQFLLVNKNGKKLYAKYAYLAVKKYLSVVTTIEKKSPHVLRHSFATHLMNEGADLNSVKELLGHTSLAATQVYTHNTIGKLKDVHKKAHPKA